MTTNFTASNGIQIFGGTGYIKWSSLTNFNQSLEFAPTSVADEAFAEWYQHRRDAELGRWRDPENPNMVVYRVPENDDTDGRAVRVIDEATGAYSSLWERDVKRFERGSMHATAARWFAAHPEPKPWESAEEGEMWLITCGTGYKNAPAIVKDGSFYFPNRYGDGMDFIDLEGVMTATRIWPTEESDDE